MWRVLFLLLISLLAAGCVYTRPTPSYATVAVKSAVPSEREKQREALSGHAEGTSDRVLLLSRGEAVRMALENNPDLVAILQETVAARARLKGAESEWWPRVSASIGYTHHLDAQRLIPAVRNGESGFFSNGIFAGDILVSMPLFLDGKTFSTVKASAAIVRSEMERSERRRQEIIFAVDSLFNAILAQKKVIEALESSAGTMQKYRDRVITLIEEKKAVPVDRLRIEVRIADLEQQLLKERNVLAVLKKILKNTIGIADTGREVEPEEAFLAQAADVSFDVEALVRDALEKRPDRRSLLSTVEAQARAVDVARAGHWPKLSLQGSYGMRWGAVPYDSPAGTDAVADVGRIGLYLDLPIWEGGRVSAEMDRERARLIALQERLRELDLRITLEVERAVLDLTAIEARIAALEKGVALARETLKMEQEKYEVGAGTTIEVLDAQTALIEAEKNLARALADRATAAAQLALARGEIR